MSCLKKSTKRAGSLGDKVVEAAQTECAVQSEKGGHVTALSLWSCRPQQCELALQDSVMDNGTDAKYNPMLSHFLMATTDTLDVVFH